MTSRPPTGGPAAGRGPLRWLLLAAGVVFVGWLVAAYGIAPRLIRSAYAGESLPIFNRLIGGQGRNDVDVYLTLWSARARQGTLLLGVKAVVAESFERIHRSNLVGMGVLPLQFTDGHNAESLGLDGSETFDIAIPERLEAGQVIEVSARKADGGKWENVVQPAPPDPGSHRLAERRSEGRHRERDDADDERRDR